MNRSNISGNRSASAAGGVGTASGGGTVPVRSAASRPQWPLQAPEGLTLDRRPSAASGPSFAPRSQLPDWRSTPLSFPEGPGQSIARSAPVGPQGWAGSVAPAPSGRGWAEVQLRPMEPSAGLQPTQSPASSTDEIYRLLNDEHQPSGGGVVSQMGGASWGLTHSQTAAGATDQGDLASAIAPFLRPATTSAAGSSRPVDAENARHIRRTQASRISRQEFEAWGREVVAGRTVANVANEISDRYGISFRTARSWFSGRFDDGISQRGRSVVYPESHKPGTSLSEEQLRFVADSTRSGCLSINDALTAIGRNDVSYQTVRDWLDRSSDDGLSDLGRRAVHRIRRDRLTGVHT